MLVQELAGQALTVNLTEMAPTLAKFCVRYHAMLERFNGWRGNLFFLYKKQSKLFQPMTTGCYSYALAKADELTVALAKKLNLPEEAVTELGKRLPGETVGSRVARVYIVVAGCG